MSISCLSPVTARQPCYSMERATGFFKALVEIVRMHLREISFIGDFLEFTVGEIDSWREKGRFLFLKTEVCLRELSLHLAQSSKFPSIFNSSSLNLDYMQKEKNRNTIPRGIIIMKHRKNCECCPGHYLIVNHYSSI